MTHLTSPSQAKRDGGGKFEISFAKYLNLLIYIDKSIKSVCIRLDEEGNYYWELDKVELAELIKKLACVLVDLGNLK